MECELEAKKKKTTQVLKEERNLREYSEQLEVLWEEVDKKQRRSIENIELSIRNEKRKDTMRLQDLN